MPVASPRTAPDQPQTAVPATFHAILATSALILAACSSSDSASKDSVDLLRVLEMDLLRQAAPRDLARAENFYNQLKEQATQDCMNSSGFEYRAVKSTVSEELFVDLTSIEVARSRGFGVADAATVRADSVLDPNENVPLRDTREYADAFADCSARAAEEVQESTGTKALRERQADLVSAIEADPAVVEASKAWSDCAAGAGYAFSSRRDLISHFVARVPAADSQPELAELRRSEIDAAVATFDCSQAFDEVWQARGQLVAEQMLGDAWTLGE